MIRGIVLFVLMISLCGCDTFYGIRREVSLNQPISAGQIEAALDETPATRAYTIESIPGYSAWNIYGTKHYPPYDRYRAMLGDIPLTVGTGWDEKHQSFLRIFYGRMNRVPTETEYSAARTVMDQIYGSLQHQDPSLPPPEQIQEKTYRPFLLFR